MAVREGFHTVTPYLTTPKLDELLDFMKRAFGAVETLRATGAAGGQHVEMRIGDSMIMVGGSSSTTNAMLMLYVDDPDATYHRAIESGASSMMKPANTSDGERRSGVRDAFGNAWFFGKPISA